MAIPAARPALSSRRLTRRALIVAGVSALTGLALAACGTAAPAGSAATAAPAAAPTQPAAAPTQPAAATPAPAPTTAAQAAAPTAGSAAGGTTVLLWSSLMGSKEAGRTAIIKDFEDANAPLKITHEGFFDIMQLNTKLLTAMVAGNPPDVISNHYYFVANYANANALEPLEPMMSQSKMDKSLFVPSIYALGQWQGKTYGLPIYADTMGYFYNTDLYKKADLDPQKPPATWQEMIDDAKKLTIRQGGKLVQEGMSVPQTAAEDTSNMFYALLLAAGGSFLSPDGTKATFGDDAGQQALQLMVDLIQKYQVTEVGFGQGLSGAATPFYAGKTASEYSIPPTVYGIKSNAPNLPYAISPLPAGPKGQATPVLAFEMFMPKAAKNKEKGWKFIAFCMQPPEQAKFNKLTNHLACEPEALKSDTFFTENPTMKAFYDSLVGFSKPFPITPNYADILSNLQQQLQAAVIGKSDVKKALDTAVSYANQQLG